MVANQHWARLPFCRCWLAVAAWPMLVGLYLGQMITAWLVLVGWYLGWT